MKKGSFLVTVSVALVTSVLLGGTTASAGGPPGARASIGSLAMPSPRVAQSIVQDSIVPGGFFTLPSAHPGIVKDKIVPGGFFSLPSLRDRFVSGRPHHRRFHRRFSGAGVVVAPPPVIIEAPPADAYGPEDYYDASGYYPPDDPSAGYDQPVVYTQPVDRPVSVAPVPPPATPKVVQYETGRYELRGDGMTTPYAWVWIPNPPPPPPPSAPPIVASPEGSGVSYGPSARPGQLYRWTDEQGVMHLTDRLESVPRQYRAQAKNTPPS